MPYTRNKAIFYLFISLLLLKTTSHIIAAQDNSSTGSCSTLEECISVAQDERRLIEFYVGSIKKKHNDEPQNITSARFSAAQEKYTKAYDKYNTWAEASAAVLRFKNEKELNRPPFRKQIGEAIAARKEFIEYAKSILNDSTERGILSTIISADFITKIYKDVIKDIIQVRRERRDALRKEKADLFLKAALWQPWDKIAPNQ